MKIIIIKLWLESTHLHKPKVTHWVYMHWYSRYIIEQKIIKGNGLVPFTFKYNYDTNKYTNTLLLYFLY